MAELHLSTALAAYADIFPPQAGLFRPRAAAACEPVTLGRGERSRRWPPHGNIPGMEPRMKARFAQLNLVVSDMERSLAFYRILGVEVGEMPHPWGDHHRRVTDTAGVTVEFDSRTSAGNWAADWDPDRTGPVVGFAVESDDAVDQLVAALVAEGHTVVQPPHDAFFGARYAVVEDPDRIPVGIMGPVDEARRWMPEPP